jgi:hypothetical protein
MTDQVQLILAVVAAVLAAIGLIVPEAFTRLLAAAVIILAVILALQAAT